jgi:hypothetical protein
MIETAGSLIEQMLPKSIHAVTPQGFELKVALFVVAYSLSCYNLTFPLWCFDYISCWFQRSTS